LVKVLVLFSGSLASRVAASLVLRHADVDSVQLLHFRSPFAAESEEFRDLIREEWPGAVVRTQSLKREYRRFVGAEGESFSLRRACTQCRSLLVSRSARYMERVGASYLVTGERLGRHGLRVEDLEALAMRHGMQGRILRPLCHRPRPRSLAGWGILDGSESLHVTGDVELERLAANLGLRPDNNLGSCERCKLTVPGFGERVTNLFCEKGFTLNSLRLLDFACYYKIEPGAKVVLAVEEEEKKELQNLFLPEDLRVYPATPHGPMALVRTDWDERSEAERRHIVEMAACIVATHTGGGRADTVPVYYRFESDDETLLVHGLALGSVDDLGDLSGVESLVLVPPEPATA